MESSPKYSLNGLILYFLRLGTTGFGGPVALVGYMHRDLVENRKWISEEEYKEGLALSQMAPGPLAAQLSIYLGYLHYGFIGATGTALAFIFPSFIMVVLLGIAYKLYGGLNWMQMVFYGVSAAVVGIIALSSYKLTIKTIGKVQVEALKKNWLLWVFYLTTAIVTVVSQNEIVLLFVGAGLANMLIKTPPKFIKTSVIPVILFIVPGFMQIEWNTLGQIAWFFTKAGSFVFGSGLAIVPYLHSGVVKEFGWLTERQFIDAVAVAMITPGPVVITVGFIGYLVAGFSGAVIAAFATFFPCYIMTVILAPNFKKIAKNIRIKTFVEGITASVMGALAGAVIVIASRTILDIPTSLIALATIATLIYTKKLSEPVIIVIAAIIGIVIKSTL